MGAFSQAPFFLATTAELGFPNERGFPVAVYARIEVRRTRHTMRKRSAEAETWPHPHDNELQQ